LLEEQLEALGVLVGFAMSTVEDREDDEALVWAPSACPDGEGGTVGARVFELEGSGA
jgi:hypothetical protein